MAALLCSRLEAGAWRSAWRSALPWVPGTNQAVLTFVSCAANHQRSLQVRAAATSSRFASTLVVVDHDGSENIPPATLACFAAAKKLGGDVAALVAGEGADKASCGVGVWSGHGAWRRLPRVVRLQARDSVQA